MRILAIAVFMISFNLSFAQKDSVLAPVLIQSLMNRPGFKSTLIDSMALASRSRKSLAEVLAENSSVFVKSYGPGALATTSFRGGGSAHTDVLWEGMSLNSPMNGQIDFSLVPAAAFDRAEIFHGPGSLNNVSGALGGSISLTTHPDWNNKMKIIASQSAGSFSNYNTQLIAAFGNSRTQSHTKVFYTSALNDFAYRNITLAEKPVVRLTNAGLLQYNIIQEVYHRLNEHNRIAIKGWYVQSEREIPAPMTNLSGGEKQNDESIRVMGEWVRSKGKSIIVNRTAFLTNALHYINPVADISSLSESRTLKNQFRYSYYLAKALTLRTGFDADYDEAKADGYGRTRDRMRAAVFAEADYSPVRQLKINALLRQEMIDDDPAPFVPSLSFEYKPFEQQRLALKANASRNFHAPSLNDLYWNPGGNPSLLPEEGYSAEAGIAYARTMKYLAVETEITNYHSIIDNWILWSPMDNGYWQASNLRQVYNRGVEASLKVNSSFRTMKAGITTNYEYLVTENRKSYSPLDASLGKQLIYVPAHKLNGAAHARYKDAFVSYSQSYTGDRFITTDNKWYLPAYLLANISAGYIVRKGKYMAELSAAVYNVWDEVYQSIAWRPMPGRNYELAVKLAFQK